MAILSAILGQHTRQVVQFTVTKPFHGRAMVTLTLLERATLAVHVRTIMHNARRLQDQKGSTPAVHWYFRNRNNQDLCYTRGTIIAAAVTLQYHVAPIVQQLGKLLSMVVRAAFPPPTWCTRTATNAEQCH